MVDRLSIVNSQLIASTFDNLYQLVSRTVIIRGVHPLHKLLQRFTSLLIHNLPKRIQ